MALLNATGIWDGASLGSTANFCAAVSKEETHISSEDRAALRSLAQEVASYAARPIEKEKRDLWTRHNDLEPTRPMGHGENRASPTPRLGVGMGRPQKNGRVAAGRLRLFLQAGAGRSGCGGYR